MPYNSRLVVFQGEKPITSFNLIEAPSKISIDGYKSDYKVVSGNRISGIEQGIGLVNAGRKLSYTIPIYENRVKGDGDIYKLIAEYTSLLLNSFSYNFYIEHFIDNYWYRGRVQIIECSKYSLKITNAIEGFMLKLIMIDNFFSGDKVVADLKYTGSGIREIEYKSKSLVPTNFTFEWIIKGTNNNLVAYIAHNNNYGIVIDYNIGAGRHKLTYDGENISTIKIDTETKTGTDTGTNPNPETETETKRETLIDFKGVQPFLNVGDNELVIYNSFETEKFTIIYRTGIAI